MTIPGPIPAEMFHDEIDHLTPEGIAIVADAIAAEILDIKRAH